MKLFQPSLGLVVALLSATILQTAQAGESRLKFDTPPSTSARVVSLSPDGDKVLFGVQHDGNRELWLLNLSSGKRQLLHEDATTPCWSPDSKAIAFTAGRGAFVRME